MELFQVVHLNVRGIRANRENLINYIQEKEFPHILTINETKMGSDQSIFIPNYDCVAQKGNRPHGSMIFKRKDILNVNALESLDHFNEEVIGIRLNGDNSRPVINIITYYNPPGNMVNPDILDTCQRQRGRTVVTGDFNCKNICWGSTKTDAQGRALLQTLNDHCLITLNDGSKTRYDPVTGKEQVLDLTICNSLMARNFVTWQVDEDIGSDHFPIRAIFSIGSVTQRATTYRNVKDTDWEDFQNRLIEVNQLPLTTAQEVENAVAALTAHILNAYHEACPLKTNRFKNKMPFTREMQAIVKEKRRLRREKAAARAREDAIMVAVLQKEINRRNNELKRLQKVFHKRSVMRKCRELNMEKDSRRFFQLFNSIKGIESQSSNSCKIKDGNDIAETDGEKADLFAKRLERLHQTREDSAFNSNWKRNIESYVEDHKQIFQIDMSSTYSQKEAGDEDLLLTPITMEEMNSCLKKCKNKSAPGDDGISYLMLKRLPKPVSLYLIKIFNSSFFLGYFPQPWKSAKIKMLPKPGKDKKEAKNWRPISLIACIGKLFERIITSRLTTHLEINGLLTPFQSGYRKGRMTTEQLFRLTEDSYSSMKKKGITAAIFLDAEAAFDQAWHDAIRYKMNEFGLPHRLVRLVSSFLYERKLKVIVGNYSSEEVTMRAGTPQGSCLSPLLYIILVNDITDVSQNASLGQFADDIALWANAYTHECSVKRLQMAINQLEGWCRRWRIKLNGAKSSLLVINRLSNTSQSDLSIQLFNDIVRPVNSARYLGVQIDNRLNFKEHFSQVEKKATSRLNIFKMLAKNGVDNCTLIRLYKTYVRPLFEYGSISFLPSKGIKRLQQIQNEFIRISLRFPRYLRTDLIHEASGLEQLETRLNSLNGRLVKKMARHHIVQDVVERSLSVIPLNNYKGSLDHMIENSQWLPTTSD